MCIRDRHYIAIESVTMTSLLPWCTCSFVVQTNLNLIWNFFSERSIHSRIGWAFLKNFSLSPLKHPTLKRSLFSHPPCALYLTVGEQFGVVCIKNHSPETQAKDHSVKWSVTVKHSGQRVISFSWQEHKTQWSNTVVWKFLRTKNLVKVVFFNFFIFHFLKMVSPRTTKYTKYTYGECI